MNFLVVHHSLPKAGHRTAKRFAKRSGTVMGHPKLPAAFTLLEVIVACAVFFMVAFAVLELVTRSLAAAKALQQRDPDPGIILAAFSLSNAFEEVSMDGNFEDIAPGMYPGARWLADIREIGSNGLFEIHVVTYNERKKSQNPVEITGQFFRPLSKPGSASKGQQ